MQAVQKSDNNAGKIGWLNRPPYPLTLAKCTHRKPKKITPSRSGLWIQDFPSQNSPPNAQSKWFSIWIWIWVSILWQLNATKKPSLWLLVGVLWAYQPSNYKGSGRGGQWLNPCNYVARNLHRSPRLQLQLQLSSSLAPLLYDLDRVRPSGAGQA